MVEYTIDDIRGPTVAREMAQLKEFVLAQFNGAIADAEAAAAAAATAAANAVLANTVKKTGEASQSIAGDVAVTGALDAAGIGSGSTPIVCGNLTAYGSVSLDDTVLQGNLAGADASALINLSGVGSVLVPAPTSNSEAATKKYVDDADALKLSITDVNTYAVGLTGNQIPILGFKIFELANGKLSTHQRVTGTSIYELFRYALPNAATNTTFMVIGMSRGTGVIGLLTIAYDGLSTIALTFNGTNLYGTPGQTGYFAYIDTANQEIVVCAGNITSGNNYMATQILGAYSGAGLEQALDFTKMATARTSEYAAAASTTSYRWCD